MMKEILLSILFISAVCVGFAIHWLVGVVVLLVGAYIQWKTGDV